MVLSKAGNSFSSPKKRGETAYKKHGRQEIVKENRNKMFHVFSSPRTVLQERLHPTLHTVRDAAALPHVAQVDQGRQH